MNFLKKRKEAKFDIIVSDDKKILADVNKIAVPDLKQYLVRGYEEIKQVKAENEQLEEQLEETLKYKEKYEATLVISDEYESRYNSQKSLTEQLEQKLESKREKINKLQEQVNDYRISEHETERKIREKIEEEIEREINDWREELISSIQNHKGNLSKAKILDIIKNR